MIDAGNGMEAQFGLKKDWQPTKYNRRGGRCKPVAQSQPSSCISLWQQVSNSRAWGAV